jgi:hypothetical protein
MREGISRRPNGIEDHAKRVVSPCPTINANAQPSSDRPSNREVENENQQSTPRDGQPPRPATEPRGAADSSPSPKTRTDPGSGES